MSSDKTLVVSNNVTLKVSDDGKIYLNVGSQLYYLADYGIQYIQDRCFLMAYIAEGKEGKIFIPVNIGSVPDVQAYFDYWDKERLSEVKSYKVRSFLAYINHCINFVRENVDVEKYKPTYETEYIDNTDCGGGIFTYINILMSFGESWDDDFDKTYELTERLTSELIDKSLGDGGDGYRWYGEFMFVFKPKFGDREDFEFVV